MVFDQPLGKRSLQAEVPPTAAVWQNGVLVTLKESLLDLGSMRSDWEEQERP